MLEFFIESPEKMYLLEEIERLLDLNNKEECFINDRGDEYGSFIRYYDHTTSEQVTETYFDGKKGISRQTFAQHICGKLRPLTDIYIKQFNKILEEQILKGLDVSRFCELQSGLIKHLINNLEQHRNNSSYPAVFKIMNGLQAELLERFPHFVPRTSYPTIKQLSWAKGAIHFSETFIPFIYNNLLTMNGHGQHTTIAGELYRFFDFPNVQEESFKKYFNKAMEKERENAKTK